LLPDFVINTNTSPAPAQPNFLENDTDGEYGFNSCRVPWRMATDFLTTGDQRSKDAVQKMTAWVRAATNDDPSQILAGYKLDGTPSAGVDYQEGIFEFAFGPAAMVEKSNQAWLDKIWTDMVENHIGDEGYYNTTVGVLCMIVMSGNWWSP
jgi:hypothetical protein